MDQTLLADSINSFSSQAAIEAELRQAQCVIRQQQAHIKELEAALIETKRDCGRLTAERDDIYNRADLKARYAIISSYLHHPPYSRGAIHKLAEGITRDLTIGGERPFPDISESSLRGFLSQVMTILNTPEEEAVRVAAFLQQANKLILALCAAELSHELELKDGLTPPPVQLRPITPMDIRAKILLDHIMQTKKVLRYADCLKILQTASTVTRSNQEDIKPAMVYRAMRRVAWLDRGVVYEKNPIRLRILRDDEVPQMSVQIDYGDHVGTR